MALSRRTVFTLLFFLVFLIQACSVVAEKASQDVAALSVQEIEEKLQVEFPFYGRSTALERETSHFTKSSRQDCDEAVLSCLSLELQ
jgi:hypothetical protein